MKYEKRVIAFLDILGFKQIIDRTLNKGEAVPGEIKKVQDLLNLFRWIFDIDNPNDKIAASKQVTQFSDSVVVSFLYNERSEIFFTLLDMLHLSINCILKGYLVRGALVIGDVIHNEKFLYGPGMVQAYEMESTAANYPRIILSEELIRLGMTYHAPHHGADYEKHALQEIISKDTDDFYYIDYFRAAFDELDDPTSEMPLYIERLRKVINALKPIKSPSIQAKFGWMKDKFNTLATIARDHDEGAVLADHRLSDLIPYFEDEEEIS